MPVLVDSNVLLDVLTEDPRWSSWSMNALAEQGDREVLAINPIIYAEVSIGFVRIEEVDAALPPSTSHRLALPWEAALFAGTCFLADRKRRGLRVSPLPDFYIGAQACVSGMRLLTRDAARYRATSPR